MRLVLDTSVIVSAVRSPLGASNKLVGLAFQRQFDLLLSVPLSCEYESVLLRPEQLSVSKLSPFQIEGLLMALMGVAVQINLEMYLGPQSIDAGDNHVLSLAAQGRADAIVTFNTRRFVRPA